VETRDEQNFVLHSPTTTTTTSLESKHQEKSLIAVLQDATVAIPVTTLCQQPLWTRGATNHSFKTSFHDGSSTILTYK
jgi:hypothetical protein